MSSSSRTEICDGGPLTDNTFPPMIAKTINCNNNNNNINSNHKKLAPPTSIHCSPSKKSLVVGRLSSRSIHLGNLVRTKLYSSFPNLHNQQVGLRKDSSVCSNSKWYHKRPDEEDENINKVLKAVASDHVVSTPVEDNKIRRTVFVERMDDEKFGFIIQSYAFTRCGNKAQMEQITYVDYVALDGPAFRAGLRAGDVILAINGKNIQNYTHSQLIRYIADCKSLRMVVLFENCVNRIELCARAIKLKKLLSDKEFELKTLTLQEDRILKGLPVWTNEEVLMLIRTPSTSPTLEERIWNCSDINSIAGSDAMSSIGVASLSSCSDDVAEEPAEPQQQDLVKFVIGGTGSESSCPSDRGSVYFRHSSCGLVRLASPDDSMTSPGSVATLNEVERDHCDITVTLSTSLPNGAVSPIKPIDCDDVIIDDNSNCDGQVLRVSVDNAVVRL